MDVEYLLGSVLRDVLTSRGKRKKAKGAMRYVLGNPKAVGGGAMLLGGLAFALYESLSKGSGIGTAPAGAPPAPPATPAPPPPPRPVGATASAGTLAGPTVVPPPLPPLPPLPNAAPATGAAAIPAGAPFTPAATPPPVPGALAAPAPASTDGVPAEILRVIRLSLSAARADGQLTATEQATILQHARQAGAEAAIAPDLQAPRPVAEILAGVTNDFQRHQLYSIAFAIVRADEQVTADERLYLQQVAAALGLDAATVSRLEQQAAAGIAGQGDESQQP